MESLPKEVIYYILDFLPNINVLKLNNYFYNIVITHPENDFWKNYDEDKIYKCGKVKMFDIIKPNISKLLVSCKYGNLDVVKYLAARNANINNNYAIEIASCKGHLHLVKYLVSQSADVNADNGFALKLASSRGHVHVVEYLLSQSANVHSEHGNHSLKMAIVGGHFNVVKCLISANANIIF